MGLAALNPFLSAFYTLHSTLYLDHSKNDATVAVESFPMRGNVRELYTHT